MKLKYIKNNSWTKKDSLHIFIYPEDRIKENGFCSQKGRAGLDLNKPFQDDLIKTEVIGTNLVLLMMIHAHMLLDY